MGQDTIFRFGEEEFTDRVDSDDFGPRTKLLYEHLAGRVIGQERGARRAAQGFSVYHAGLKDPTAPVATLLFAGPTGWGKTHMAEEIARFLIGDDARAPLTRIQCGKYSERHRVAELIGSPPGYVDSDKVPGLAQIRIDEKHFWAKVRPQLEKAFKGKEKRDPDEIMAELYEANKPYYSVILFDEVEKAHGDLHNALLHIIDDGELSFPHGGMTYFHNSVIILTCNVGGAEQQELLAGKGSMGFGRGSQSLEEMSEDQAGELDRKIYEQTISLIEKRFPPELVGRLRDDIVVFRTLNRPQQKQILEIMLAKVQDQLAGKNSNSIPLSLQYTDGFKEHLLDEGINRKYGVRPLKRKVRKLVKLPIANAIEAGRLKAGDEVLFKMVGGKPAIYRKPWPELPPPKRLPPAGGNGAA
jgi:ATP-dependent Clp protease ATP-binding subunit ClpC